MHGQVLEGRGGRMRFETTRAQSGGRLLVTRSVLPAGFPPPPRHVHPGQEERFEVLSGRVVVEAAGTRHLLCAGESLTVPAGRPHRFAIAGPGPADLRVSFSPAGGMEDLLVALAALEGGGRLSRRGLPHPRAVLRLADAHAADLRLTGAREALLRLGLTMARALRPGPG